MGSRARPWTEVREGLKVLPSHLPELLVGLCSLGRTPGTCSTQRMLRGAAQPRHCQPKVPLLLCKGQQRGAQTPWELQTLWKNRGQDPSPSLGRRRTDSSPETDPNSSEVRGKAHYLHLALALALCSPELWEGSEELQHNQLGKLCSHPKAGKSPRPFPTQRGRWRFRLGPIEGNNIPRTASLG